MEDDKNKNTLVSISAKQLKAIKSHIEKHELKYSSMRQFIDIAVENQMRADSNDTTTIN